MLSSRKNVGSEDWGKKRSERRRKENACPKETCRARGDTREKWKKEAKELKEGGRDPLGSKEQPSLTPKREERSAKGEGTFPAP